MRIKHGIRLDTEETGFFEQYHSDSMPENWRKFDLESPEIPCSDLRKEYFTCLDLKTYWEKSKDPTIVKKVSEFKAKFNDKISLVYFSECTKCGFSQLLKQIRKQSIKQLVTLLCFSVMRSDESICEMLRLVISRAQQLVEDSQNNCQADDSGVQGINQNSS